MAHQNESVAFWLEISSSLLRSVIPNIERVITAIAALSPDAHTRLVDAESARVDHALVALATSAGESEVKALARQLSAETVMALASRWAHYAAQWKQMLQEPDPHLWVPPIPQDVWRAVLLAMTGEGDHSSAALAQLWPERFGAANG